MASIHSLTTALDGGEWLASRSDCALASELVWTQKSLRVGLDTETRRNILCSAGDRAPAVQSVVRHYTG
jgi:hypothetical protein